MKAICVNCKFYTAGECHRMPPVTVTVPVVAQFTNNKEMPYQVNHIYLSAGWAKVQHNDWCGEFHAGE